MDYLFENLGDERFQEFCSSLISKEFPNFQAYPVGQPDGGRDTIVYQMSSTEKDFIVFQVKYVRNPHEERDLHKWLATTIEGEKEKIQTLIPKGAKAYYLLTNIKGTAHLDVGSKDIVNEILEKNINIPAICWWRDDLARLFEKDPEFAWSFLEILNGQDVLNSVLYRNLTQDNSRKENVLRAYLVDQYSRDKDVKFQQVDLKNRLFELFTDVPVRIKKFNSKDRSFQKSLKQLIKTNQVIADHRLSTEDQIVVNAAELLLHPVIQSDVERLLLEGGPGQGKSTISQYICQIHRVKLLDVVADLELIPTRLKKIPVRLPFKIDLRHIATWIEKKNPYDGDTNNVVFETNWKNSLESFLLAHIRFHSQIDDFAINDLLTIFNVSPILMVFDGFDEIADIKMREEVIDFINKGINRLNVNTNSLQIIITSRPAAFSDSIGFPVEQYPHFELIDITPQITHEYIKKWIKANELEEREGLDFLHLAEEKLKLPHLQELAKSPMQLAIFISLLRKRGQSLPNKRTALYDSYIDHFFNREAEKSPLVLEHRDLIIDIHQYLAWILHSEAELYKTGGSIQIEELKRRLKDYLFKEGHESNIADKLFDVMHERVCALVSRVQGTFEFEVQPLREYFCAKFLYETAPLSAVGSETTGSKPDRLNAIFRRFYWQNVVRFFAGCVGKGEIPMLIAELKDLNDDEQLKFTNYPKIIAAQLLSDYVFKQAPRQMEDVIQIIINWVKSGNIVNQQRRWRSSNEPIILPPDYGGLELERVCFQELENTKDFDHAMELCGVINNNSYNKTKLWLEILANQEGFAIINWIRYGRHLNTSKFIELRHLDAITDEFLVELVKTLLQSDRIDLVSSDPKLKRIAYDIILNKEVHYYPAKHFGLSLEFLYLTTAPFLLFHLTKNYHSRHTLSDFIESSIYNTIDDQGMPLSIKINEFPIVDEIDRKVELFSNEIDDLLNMDISSFNESFNVWNQLIGSLRTVFGSCWRIKVISVTAAGMISSEKLSQDFPNLHDESEPLFFRVRYSRLRSGNAKYWEKQLDQTNDPMFALLSCLTWATPKTLFAIRPLIQSRILSLTNDEIKLLAESLSYTVRASVFNNSQVHSIVREASALTISNEFKYLISIRMDYRAQLNFIINHINELLRFPNLLIECKFNVAIEEFISSPISLENLLIIKNLYSNLDVQETSHYLFDYAHMETDKTSTKMPIEIAKTINNENRSFPKILNIIAEKALRRYVQEHSVPVGKVAKTESWF